MDLQGEKVAVIGLGASGVAAARLALEKGADVYVSEVLTNDAVTARGADLRAMGIAVETGGHDIERMAEAGIVIASPGIPPHAPVLRALGERGAAWISEPEFAARFYTGSLIAVTGTNGKTTVTLLVEHLLRASGLDAAAGGNVGGGLAPTASDLARRPHQPTWVVLEVSSFQLAAVERFDPDIGVVTNLSPDHLDRYKTVESYYRDKKGLFANATDASTWVFPFDDPEVASIAVGVPGRRFHFGYGGGDALVDEGDVTLRMDGMVERILPVDEIPLVGRHNVVNALAAALVARIAGAEVGGIAAGLGSARGLPHRLEPVREMGGVLWVNDSKATNVAAARSAVRSLGRPIVLLAGGKDKGEDFKLLAVDLVGRVRHVLVFGDAGARLRSELTSALEGGGADSIEVEHVAGDLDDVVRRAARVARPGDVVLLSPACSSFDMYDGYEHRGRHFTRLVREAA